MQGRSGCRIDLLESNGKPVVRKYAKDLAYNDRLLRQAGKQAVFNQYLDMPSIKAPNVLGMSKPSASELTWFDMEYLSAQKFSDYFERIGRDGVQYLVRVLTDYFEVAAEKSMMSKINPVVFENKCAELTSKLKGNECFDQQLLTASLKCLEKAPAEEIITGRCHGDMTFSNLLFDGKQIFAIDFLDSFVESPVVDVVKLRQDTKYFWSLMLDKNISAYTRNRSIQVLNYVDQALSDYIRQNDNFSTWYIYLQLFNFMRILPYLESPEEILFVENVIKDLIKKCS